jgi:acyl-CoA synthetase (AMP-forming)/AMP-acid ligase II
MTKAFDKAAAAGPHTLRNLLDALAEQNADSVAIVAPGRVPLSYSRLRSHVDVVAKTLGRLGFGRNHRVAVALPNGPEMAVAFASIACFATCAPLNPAYRFDEFDFCLADLKAGALIVPSGSGSPAIAAAQKHSIPVVELTPAVDGPAGIFSLTVTSGASNACPDFSRADDNALVLHTRHNRVQMVALTHSQLMACKHCSGL